MSESSAGNCQMELLPEVTGRVFERGALDKQEGGSHYSDMAIQPVEYIAGNNIPYLEGNVIKYVSRHRAKNGVEDIKKAIHYLEMIKERTYGQ